MTNKICVGDVAHARSGDKGNHANIGVVAYNEQGYQFLKEVLTEAIVSEFFADLSSTKVERFELPGIYALNFLLDNALAGGASQSLRTDSQGKVLGIALMGMLLPSPPNLESMRKKGKSDV